MTNYFSHDSNARNDEKLITLRILHGWEGYGLYWAIIEKLRDATDYQLSTDYSIIAYDLRTDVPTIKSIVCDFNLFEVETNYFYAPSLCKRMCIKDTKSEKARHSAKSRWESNKETTTNIVSTKKNITTQNTFAPPSELEVESYCRERQNTISPQKFVNFYESKGWMVGSNKMKDWKAAVRIWERNQNRNNEKESNEQPDATARLHPALQ